MGKRIYTFDFDPLTLGDVRNMLEAIAAKDTSVFLRVVAKCLPGMWDLPMTELGSVCSQFSIAIKQRMDDAQAPDAIRLLRSMFDGQDSGL